MRPIIVFTGGHHNSTLEVAKCCREAGYQVYWLGHKFASLGDKSFSAEYQEVTAANIKFTELKAGRFYRRLNFLEVLKIIFGFIQSFGYLVSVRPNLIFSSGGYLSVPVVISGWLLGIPSITHEQTVVAGWANKAITPFVKKILLTHPSSIGNFPVEKSVVVGLPLRQELLDKSNKRKYLPRLLYVTCGKQGSHTINQAFFPLIPKLVSKFTIVHQTGSNTLTKDVDRARRIKDRLGHFSDRYTYAPYYFAKDAARHLLSSDVVVSRSGAHITYELMALSKKVVLIPIPWVSHNEQLLNAKLAVSRLTGAVIEEKNLTPETLYESIIKISKEPRKICSDKLETNATEKVFQIIQTYLPVSS